MAKYIRETHRKAERQIMDEFDGFIHVESTCRAAVNRGHNG